MSIPLRLLFLFCCFSLSLLAQKRDNVWLFGSVGNTSETDDFGISSLCFDSSPPDTLNIPESSMSLIEFTNASICDTSGQLLFYTNGIFIANSQHDTLENGAGLNPGPFSEGNVGYPVIQGAVIVPHPGLEDYYYILHCNLVLTNTLGLYSHKLYYTLVNIQGNGDRGVVDAKNVPLIIDTLNVGHLTVCQHANGRDWWLLTRQYNSNAYYRVLIDTAGCHLDGIQVIGDSIPDAAGGQAIFSPDGSQYVSFDMVRQPDDFYVSIFDFDRCTGLLSQPDIFSFQDSVAFAGGAAISPNSRYLYLPACYHLYQYDLWADNVQHSRQVVAEYDGFEDILLPTLFFMAQLAPDGKIYISSTNGTKFLHVIEQPDEAGLACGVQQHSFELATYNGFSVPNFPNYRLGPQEAPCAVAPVAAYTYEVSGLSVAFSDASGGSPDAWAWSFGDPAVAGTPADSSYEALPVHTYAAPGQYEVCLRVSNEVGSDIHCEWVSVTLLSGDEAPLGSVQLLLFPNPASRSLNLLVPASVETPLLFQLYDLSGRLVLEAQLRTNEAIIDISLLDGGLYFYEINAAGDSLIRGKVMIVL